MTDPPSNGWFYWPLMYHTVNEIFKLSRFFEDAKGIKDCRSDVTRFLIGLPRYDPRNDF